MKFKRARKRFDVSEIKLALCMVLISEVFALIIELTWCYNANAEFMKSLFLLLPDSRALHIWFYPSLF